MSQRGITVVMETKLANPCQPIIRREAATAISRLGKLRQSGLQAKGEKEE